MGASLLPPRVFYLLPLACYWLVLIYYMGAQWSVFEQYRYGWAVPFLCLYLLWRRIAQVSPPADPASAPISHSTLNPQASTLLAPSHLPSSIFYLLLVFFALLYAAARFLHEANPVWRLTSWVWALAVLGLTLLLLRATDRASRFTLHASRFTFPICFFLVAVPWPSGLENFLTQSLMRLNVTSTVELLGLFGVPAVQHGNVIEVGTGVVGIDEACSGIRSLQATLMISLFLGELCRLGLARRLWLVLSGFALAFVFNVGRTLLLTGIAAAKGVKAVGSWHDPAGVTILVGCFLSLWLLALRLKGKSLTTQASKSDIGSSMFDGDPQHPPATLNPSAFGLQPLAFGLLAWFVFVEGGTELWYRLHEQPAAHAVNWSVPQPAGDAAIKIVEMPAGIRGQFRADEGIQLRWQDASGAEWQLYYFRWVPALSLRKRVAVHLAKTHGPEKCLPAAGMKLRSDVGMARMEMDGLDFGMHQYEFEAEGKPVQVFYGIYEDQGGGGELANRRLTPVSRIHAALAGSRNYGQRFLEVAVAGYARPEDARAALPNELQKVIRVQ
jgi:exosortase